MIGKLLAIPGAKIMGGIIVLLLLALPLSYCAGRSDGVKLTEAKHAAIAAQALAQAREADVAAQESVERDTAVSAAEIQRGREAAVNADDPWRAATEEMRK